MKTRQSFLWLALLVALTLPLGTFTGCIDTTSGADLPVETREDTFTTGASVSLNIDVFNGAVTVVAEPGDTVQVVANLRGPDRIDYSASLEDGTVKVKATRKGLVSNRSVNVEVHAPAGTTATIRTSNGAIEVRGLTSSLTLDTSNGAIDVYDVKGSVDADTSNGAITVTGAGGQVNLETSNGAVRYEGFLPAGSENRIATSNGEIEVTLAGEPSVAIDASTSNGGVTTTLPIVIERSSKSALSGKIGGGDAKLNIDTSNGAITIR